MECIALQPFICRPINNRQGYGSRHAKRQPKNIYTGINLIPNQVPPCGFEVAFKHKKKFVNLKRYKIF